MPPAINSTCVRRSISCGYISRALPRKRPANSSRADSRLKQLAKAAECAADSFVFNGAEPVGFATRRRRQGASACRGGDLGSPGHSAGNGNPFPDPALSRGSSCCRSPRFGPDSRSGRFRHESVPGRPSHGLTAGSLRRGVGRGRLEPSLKWPSNRCPGPCSGGSPRSDRC